MKFSLICEVCGTLFKNYFKKKTCSKECNYKLVGLKNTGKKHPHTEITKRIISEKLTGVTGKISPEGIQKLTEIHVGNKNPMCHITEEERNLISVKYSGDNNPNRKYSPEKLREQHDNLIDEYCKKLEEEGYCTVPLGKWKTPIADIIAFKDGKTVCYEITSHYPEKHKWDNFKIFDDIIWIRFKKDKSCKGYIFGARLKKVKS